MSSRRSASADGRSEQGAEVNNPERQRLWGDILRAHRRAGDWVGIGDVLDRIVMPPGVDPRGQEGWAFGFKVGFHLSFLQNDTEVRKSAPYSNLLDRWVDEIERMAPPELRAKTREEKRAWAMALIGIEEET